jgi:molybdopterin converting factor small subunit
MARATVRIPAPLRPFTGGAGEISAEGASVAEVLGSLAAQHGDLASRILTPDGALRRFVNLYVDGTDIRSLEGLAAPVQDGAVLHIVPAVAGGVR